MEIPDNWTFKSKDIADNFDSHVAEQLPWYPMALDMLSHLARSYLPVNGVLLDLGCSTGAVTASLKEVIKDRSIKAVSVDYSQEMLTNFRGVGEVVCCDMTQEGLIKPFDVAILNLSLMFVPMSSRPKLISDLIKNTNEGGCIIVIDKLDRASAGYLGLCISRMSLSNKILSGNSPDEILKKELSLTGYQRPSRSYLFDSEGFEKWLQIGDFSGYIYEKK